jgi:hypothetical protein
MGEDKIMAILHRLDRLTQEEARMTVAQTLEVVQGLVSNMKVVMDGESELTKLSHSLCFSGQTAKSLQRVFATLSVSSKCGHWVLYSSSR